MDFIRQLNAFEDYLERNCLPDKEELFWRRIFRQANVLCWPEWFQCDNIRLAAKVGVTEKTLIELRNRLKQRGLIDYIQGKKGKPTRYKMTCLYKNTVMDTVQTTVQTTVEPTVEPTGINKHKHKQKTNSESSDSPTPTKITIDYYHEKFVSMFVHKPVISGGKDGALIKKLVSQYGIDKVLDLLDQFFASNDTFIQQSGYSIGAFYGQVNKLIAANVIPMSKRKIAMGEDLPWG